MKIVLMALGVVFLLGAGFFGFRYTKHQDRIPIDAREHSESQKTYSDTCKAGLTEAQELSASFQTSPACREAASRFLMERQDVESNEALTTQLIALAGGSAVVGALLLTVGALKKKAVATS